VASSPAPLELGVMNYRKAVRMAVDAGFRGVFLTEHYGGDGLGVCATNREYLRRVLPVTTPLDAA
jgi:alkanesulfonate monooxygenase SsuD/methylene tetrahydromethanopterin reductase-like flavin-dependent oxidoreductase (luciferase family)